MTKSLLGKKSAPKDAPTDQAAEEEGVDHLEDDGEFDQISTKEKRPLKDAPADQTAEEVEVYHPLDIDMRHRLALARLKLHHVERGLVGTSLFQFVILTVAFIDTLLE